jgi:hypothetical protein
MTIVECRPAYHLMNQKSLENPSPRSDKAAAEIRPSRDLDMPILSSVAARGDKVPAAGEGVGVRDIFAQRAASFGLT